MSIVNFKGYSIETWSQGERAQYFRSNLESINKNIIRLPTISIHDLTQTKEIDLKPIMDVLSNAAGYSGCDNFDDNGTYTGKRR